VIEPTVNGVRQWRKSVEHAFPTPNPLDSALYLKGELAELLMAYHKAIAPRNHKRNPQSDREDIAGELGDCILMLLTFVGHAHESIINDPGLALDPMIAKSYRPNKGQSTSSELTRASEFFRYITSAERDVNRLIDHLFAGKVSIVDRLYVKRIYTILVYLSFLIGVTWHEALNQTTAKIEAAFL
jgi:NTP pyrophosphatase (non-canonical NTP hydrolase)